MPNSRFIKSFCFVALILAVPLEAFAQDSSARWLRDFSAGFRTGGCFLSEPTSGVDFSRGLAVGADLSWGIFFEYPHRARLTVGFLDYSVHREKGTPEIRVETDYARVDFAAGYDFTWRLLVAGVDVGYAMMVDKVRTSYGDPTWSVSEGAVVYEDPENPDVREEVGVDGGLLAGLSLGVEFGELWGVPDLLELRVRADYALRSGRNEIAVLGVIEFWPLAWMNK